MLYQLLQILNKVIPAKTVYAHCDIPCAIYTPEPAHTAARTVIRMVEKIEELEGDPSSKEYQNAMTRFVTVKEEHAQICKEQLLILWTDYFKPEHLEMLPDLHETFWKAAKMCSKVKQEVNMASSKELLEAVELIASMFEKAEEAKSK